MGAQFDEDISWVANDAEQIQRVVKALYRVHRLLSVITDIDALLARITEEGRSVAQAEASSLLLYDAEADELYFHIALGLSGDQDTLKRKVRLKLNQGIAGAAAATHSSIVVDNVSRDPRFFADVDAIIQFQTRNLLAVPLMDRDRLIGVLELVNKSGGGTFSTLDRQVMEMFASLAASAVVNARLIEEQIRNERLAAIGQAVTGLSHYTKNIVTGLSSSADLIDMGLKTNNLEVLQRTWPVFKRSTRRISLFVQDMLSYSKPRNPVRESCRLPQIIEEARQTFAELFVRKNIDLQINTQEMNRPVFVDPQGLYRCLLNLLTNAADAVPEPGGCVEITARAISADRFEITVADNGPGVPEDLRHRIFDPFFSTKGTQGTGLGLAVSRKIAREHGGDVSVESASSGGALFRIILPMNIPAQEDGKEA